MRAMRRTLSEKQNCYAALRRDCGLSSGGFDSPRLHPSTQTQLDRLDPTRTLPEPGRSRSRPAWPEIARDATRAGTDGRGREHPGVRERHHTPAVRAHAPASVPGALDPTPYRSEE